MLRTSAASSSELIGGEIGSHEHRFSGFAVVETPATIQRMSDDEGFLGISREGWRDIATAWLTGAAYSLAVGVALAAALWMAL